MSLPSLPSELLSRVGSHLSPTSLYNLSLSHPSLTSVLSPHHPTFFPDLLPHLRPPHPPSPLSAFHHYLLHATRRTCYLSPHKASYIQRRYSPDFHFNPPSLFILSHEHISHHHIPPNPTSIYSLTFRSTATAFSYPVVGLSSGHLHILHPNPLANPLRSHTCPISSCRLLSPTLVAAAGHDLTIRLKHPETRRSLLTLRGHAAPVPFLGKVSDTMLVSHGAKDATVKLWDLAKGVCVGTGRPVGREGIIGAVCEEGTVYVAGKRSVGVIDVRVGVDRLVAVLGIGKGDGPIEGLRGNGKGDLLAGAGKDVVVWEGRGGWEGRRFRGRERVKCVWRTEEGVMAGTEKGIRTWNWEGEEMGMVGAYGRENAVKWLVAADHGVVVSRENGYVQWLSAQDGGWERVEEIVKERWGNKGKGFW